LSGLELESKPVSGKEGPINYKGEMNFNMDTTETYIGIDVAQQSLDLASYPTGQIWKYKNDKHGIAKTVEKMQLVQPKLIVMEATGGLEVPLRQALEEDGLPVAVVNPRRIRDFGRAMGMLAKTDKLDAKVMAYFAAKIEPEARPAADAEIQKLKHILERREQLQEMLTAERNRLNPGLDPAIQQQIQAHIDWIEQEIQDLEKLIKEKIKSNPKLLQKVELLRSMKGVGDILSATLVAKLPELGHLNQREIAALVGLAPFNRDSGRYRGKRTIWGGRATVRKAFYMPVLAAIRCNSVIRILYQRLIEQGKVKKVALVACMHKMLTILNSMMKNNLSWQQSFTC
jgi:transposase